MLERINGICRIRRRSRGLRYRPRLRLPTIRSKTEFKAVGLSHCLLGRQALGYNPRYAGCFKTTSRNTQLHHVIVERAIGDKKPSSKSFARGASREGPEFHHALFRPNKVGVGPHRLAFVLERTER